MPWPKKVNDAAFDKLAEDFKHAFLGAGGVFMQILETPIKHTTPSTKVFTSG
jgi:hypothetical protein